VEAIGNAVPPNAAALYTLIVIVAAAAEVFATTIDSTLNTALEEAALLANDVAEVVESDTDDVLPITVVTFTKFGADIGYSPRLAENV